MKSLPAIDIETPRSLMGASRRQVVRTLFALAPMSVLPLAGVRRAHARQQGPEASATSEEEPMDFAVSGDGTRIAYQRAGEGPPLVLIHGTADNHTIWSQLMPVFGERFTVYAIDRRGRGESEETDPESYAIEREIEDVVAIVDAVGEPAYVLGHSFGAICALEAALKTDKLLKLVLYEPPILISPEDSGIPVEAVEALDQLLAEGDNEGVMLTFAREIAQVPEEAITAFRSMPEWQASVDMADTIVREVHAVGSYVFEPERFRDLSVPALLLMGGESPPYLQTATEAVAAALPNDQVVTLEGQGHLAMAFDPEGFTHQIFAFLSDER
jgi:pimeloyl-ACP methyl ester carboxylesterase